MYCHLKNDDHNVLTHACSIIDLDNGCSFPARFHPHSTLITVRLAIGSANRTVVACAGNKASIITARKQ